MSASSRRSSTRPSASACASLLLLLLLLLRALCARAPAATRFSATSSLRSEGAESLIPGLKALVDRATELGVTGVVFGMPHRGRLNVLVNVIRKPMEKLLREFQGTHVDLQRYAEKLATGDWSGSGDVKYHLGTSYDRTYPDGRRVHLALVAVRARARGRGRVS